MPKLSLLGTLALLQRAEAGWPSNVFPFFTGHLAALCFPLASKWGQDMDRGVVLAS